MRYYLTQPVNIVPSIPDTYDIPENEDENGATYNLYDITSGYNNDYTLKYGENIYKSQTTIFPLVNYVWKDLIVGSEYTINMHTQTDIYRDGNGKILIDIYDEITTVYVESNQKYYIANKTAIGIDFLAESITSPANFTEITDVPIRYRKDYNAPSGQSDTAIVDTLYWEYISVANKFRAFDRAIGSRSSKAEKLTYTFEQNSVSGLILINTVGTTVTIELEDLITGDVFDPITREMIDTSHLDTYEKVCTGIPLQETTAFFQFSASYSLKIKVTIENAGADAQVGAIKLGSVEDLGITLDGVDARNKSYNESGIRDNGEYVWNPTDKEENKVSILAYEIIFDSNKFDSIHRKLQEMADKDIVLLGDERDIDAFKTLQTYCVVTDANATLESNRTKSRGSVNVETFK